MICVNECLQRIQDAQECIAYYDQMVIKTEASIKAKEGLVKMVAYLEKVIYILRMPISQKEQFDLIMPYYLTIKRLAFQ